MFCSKSPRRKKLYKEKSARVYLNQIIHNIRPASRKFREALYELSGRDERITRALANVLLEDEVSTKLYSAFTGYFWQMDCSFRNSNNTDRISILAKLEKLCEELNSPPK